MTEYTKQWKVKSHSTDEVYTVSLTKSGLYECSCKHWIYRCKKTGEHCKHIQEVIDNGTGPYMEFVLIPANVREVTLDDDLVTIHVPLIPLEDVDFLATVAYDLAVLGVSWKAIKERYRLSASWTRDKVFDHVKFSGRKIYGPWVEGQGHVGFEYRV